MSSPTNTSTTTTTTTATTIASTTTQSQAQVDGSIASMAFYERVTIDSANLFILRSLHELSLHPLLKASGSTTDAFQPQHNANHAALANALGHFRNLYEVLYGIYCVDPQSPVLVQVLAHWLKSIGLLVDPFSGGGGGGGGGGNRENAVSLEISTQIYRIHAIIERLYMNKLGNASTAVANMAPYPRCLGDTLYSETLEFIRSKFAAIYVMFRFATVLSAMYAQTKLMEDVHRLGAADPRMSAQNIVNATFKMQSLFKAYGMFSATVEAATHGPTGYNQPNDPASGPSSSSSSSSSSQTVYCDAISIIEMLNSVDESTFNEVIGVAQSIGPMVSSIASSMGSSSSSSGAGFGGDPASIISGLMPMLMASGGGGSSNEGLGDLASGGGGSGAGGAGGAGGLVNLLMMGGGGGGGRSRGDNDPAMSMFQNSSMQL